MKFDNDGAGKRASADTSQDDVLLVDADDRIIGRAPKLLAHQQGLLHRAFSVFIRDRDNRLLLQQRAGGKYHSANLWTNACCGHPREGEETRAAAERRLNEEMGFTCPLVLLFSTQYRADVSNGLTEHEIVHVYGGDFVGKPVPDPGEVGAWRWESLDDILAEVDSSPERYTAWFRIYRRDFLERLRVWLEQTRTTESFK
jgi:isopentenyl-diphosphate delta-isomerase